MHVVNMFDFMDDVTHDYIKTKIFFPVKIEITIIILNNQP